MALRRRSSSGIRRIIPKVCMIVILITVLVLAVVYDAFYHVVSNVTTDEIPIVTPQPTPMVESTEQPLLDPNVEIVEEEAMDQDLDNDVKDDLSDEGAILSKDEEPQPIYHQEPINEEIVNVLIIGTDTRSSNSRGRSDTMMLLSYNLKDNSISLISFMRDVWVPIKGHSYNRLNAAYAFGGPGLTINTFNQVFELDIQNYVTVDFDGMAKLIDKIGGVEVPITEVEAAYYNKRYGWNISDGVNSLNGQRALLHARNRKSDGGDFERTRRQRDIMVAVYSKIKDQYDIRVLTEYVLFATESIKTNMTPNQIFSLATHLLDNIESDFHVGRVPKDKTWKYARKGGRSVIVINFDKNIEYLHDVIYE